MTGDPRIIISRPNAFLFSCSRRHSNNFKLTAYVIVPVFREIGGQMDTWMDGRTDICDDTGEIYIDF